MRSTWVSRMDAASTPFRTPSLTLAVRESRIESFQLGGRRACRVSGIGPAATIGDAEVGEPGCRRLGGLHPFYGQETGCRNARQIRFFSSCMFSPRPRISLVSTSKLAGVPASSVFSPLTMLS